MNIDKLTVRDLCTISVLCKDELARLCENGTSGSEWAGQVQELAIMTHELLEEHSGIIIACKRSIALLYVTESNLDDAVADVGAIMEGVKDDGQAKIEVCTATQLWKRFLARLVGLGYAVSVEHDRRGLYAVTLYKGGAKL